MILLALTACDEDELPPVPEPPWGEEDSGGDSGGDSDTAEADSGCDDPGPPDPDDADGDGHLSPEAGGDDCDDADATRFPGAVEPCDAIDQDCDGVAILPATCGDTQALDAIARRVAMTWSNGTARVVGDVTGDGRPDLLYQHDSTTCPDGSYAGDYTGTVSLYSGDVATWPTGVHPDGAVQVWTESVFAWATSEALVEVGDVDGDGYRDVGVITTSDPALHLHFGPFDEPGATGLIEDDDETWGAPWGKGWWGQYAVGGADFDGDGRGDVVVQTESWMDAEQVSADVYFGGEFEWGSNRRILGGGSPGGVTLLEDLDQDGITDLWIHDGGRFWLSGAELRDADHTEIFDLALATFTSGTDDGSRGYFDRDWVSVGDLDGDGYPEVAAGSDNARTGDLRHGEIAFFSGATRGDFHLDDALGSYVGDEERPGMGSFLRQCDLDGDGARDLIASSSEPSQWLVIPLRDGVPALSTPLPERVWRFDFAWSLLGCEHDVTGDGLPDMAVVAGDPLIEYLGIVPGWPIPWDEDEWW